MDTLPFILGFGLPSQLQIEPENPHCLNLTWKKAPGPVTGYRVYCYSGDSQQAEIIKDIHDSNLDMAFVSGLKPETVYRVGIASVASGIESKLAFSEENVKLRKSIRNNFFLDICSKFFSCKYVAFICSLIIFSAGIHHLVLDQNLVTLRKNLIIGKRIGRLWEKKSSPHAQYVSPTANRDDRVRKFTEWLKWQPLKDYMHFMRLLHETKQKDLAEQMTKSCKDKYAFNNQCSHN